MARAAAAPTSPWEADACDVDTANDEALAAVPDVTVPGDMVMDPDMVTLCPRRRKLSNFMLMALLNSRRTTRAGSPICAANTRTSLQTRAKFESTDTGVSNRKAPHGRTQHA